MAAFPAPEWLSSSRIFIEVLACRFISLMNQSKLIRFAYRPRPRAGRGLCCATLPASERLRSPRIPIRGVVPGRFTRRVNPSKPIRFDG